MDLILLATMPYSGTNFVANILNNSEHILELKRQYLSWLDYRDIILPYIDHDFIERIKKEFPLRCKYVYIQNHIDELLGKYLLLHDPVDMTVVTTIRNPYNTIRSAILQHQDYSSLNEFIAVATRYLTLLWMIKKYNPIIIQIDSRENDLRVALNMFGELGLPINNKIVNIIKEWNPVNVGDYERNITDNESEFIKDIIGRLGLINKIKEVTNIEYNIS